MVVHSNRQHFLGTILTNDILIQHLLYFMGLGQLVAGSFSLFFELLADDVIAELYAFIAHKHGWPGNEFAHFVLALATERAVQQLAIILFAA